MANYKRFVVILLSVLFLAALLPAALSAQDVAPDAGTDLDGQLTAQELQELNAGQAEIFVHNDRVTFVDGSCTSDPVKNAEDAEKVVDSMIDLLGGDDRTHFDFWRELTDGTGNKYYVFQQMYANTSILGGAVKVITDQDGNMIGLTSSIETELPDTEESEGITLEEAEEIVLRHAIETNHPEPTIIKGRSAKMILPVFLSMAEIVEVDEADYSRFVWVVYTNNPENTPRSAENLPYLAHYVAMDGTYLYNLGTIFPGDPAGASGFDASYVFEFMEPADYTGYVDLSDGTEMELTVTLMRDKRTGMYFLGNIERQIVVADCYEFLYNGDRIVLEYSPDNMEWDQVGLLALYNMCKAYDYYKEIGWIGGDGNGTPILILNNIVDENHIRIDNAAFFGNYLGWSIFGVSLDNDLTQALDVIAHEFTHCVTHSVMTYNSYRNDYGAINEAISDIQGQICDMMDGNEDDTDWVVGDKSSISIRIMSDPNRGRQPAYSWDIYYKPPVRTPTAINDNGGVHSNSSLLNLIAYLLVNDGGMSLEEARDFWFALDCAMVPGTDHAQLRELMPWMLETLGMEQYQNAMARAIDAVRLGYDEMPDFFDADRALVTLNLPDNENFTDDNWAMQIVSLDIHGMIDEGQKIINGLKTGDYSSFPAEVRAVFEKAEQQAEKARSEQEKQGFLDVILDLLSNEEKAPEPAEDVLTDEETKIITEWISKKLAELFYMGMGAAGPDGRTIRMVTRPGRTVPLLMHMAFKGDSQVPDQVVMTLFMNGKWYILPAFEFTEDMEISMKESDVPAEDNPLAQDIAANVIENLGNIHSLDDFLDLFTTNIPGGDVLELPSTGLEMIVLPEPSGETENNKAVPTEPQEPAKKSRPKL